MHVISYEALRLFWTKHPDSEGALSRWYKIVQNGQFESFDELRKTFPSADKVGKLIVFNIGGNKYRLIAAIHFNRSKIYIRHILTHSDYDKEIWKV